MPSRTGAQLAAACVGALALGCGATGEASAPARVPVLAAGGDRTFATFGHTCAAVDDTVQCWGASGLGQLGDGIATDRSPLPVRTRPLPGRAEALAAGGAHTCALAQGRVFCWGHNAASQLGRSGVAFLAAPGAIEGLPGPATAIAAGRRHTCAVVEGGLYCWGQSEAGELGATPPERCRGHVHGVPCSDAPLALEGLARPVTAVALGAAHSCAAAGGEVVCWGRNDRGQLGRGAAGDEAGPRAVEGLAGPVTALAAGADHTCALGAGRVACWGAGDAGQLGDGGRADRARAAPVRDLPDGVSVLTAGRRHTCAATPRGAWCWGAGDEGQLGSGHAGRATPQPVAGLDGRVTALAAGADHTCAVLDGARVVCWGDNDFGQLGNGEAPRDRRGLVAVADWDSGRIRDVNGDGRIVVACLGDSNTAPRPGRSVGWCELLDARFADPAWSTVNRGLGGATAAARASLRPAREQLAYALENDAPDVVVAAFGTNDLLGDHAPEQVALAILQLRQRARSAGVAFYAATTPPALPPERPVNAAVTELNTLLAKALPPEQLIDFAKGLDPRDYEDGIHLNDRGQQRRARAAHAALRAAGAPGEAR